MSEVPAWLAEALATNPVAAEADLREESPAEVLPGDICVVKPFDRGDATPRLFLVLDAAGGWCEGMLASAETELATEVDAILSTEETGLGYPIAIHTRYLGPVWMTQIQRRAGAVVTDTLATVERLAWNDEAHVGVRVGLPLQPEDIDPRYPMLRALSADFDALTDHCRRRRDELDGPVLDPALADPVVLKALLAEPGWEMRVGAALSSSEFREGLLEAFPQLSPDERRVVMPLIERATVGQPSHVAQPSSLPLAPDHSNPEALARAIALRAEGTMTTVLSHRLCWRGSPSQAMRVRISSREEWIVFESFSDVPLGEVA